jgi:hypothetical protein
MRRSFNPYSSAPPPPSSLPDFSIDPSSIISLTNEEAGVFIDSFLQTQNGKVLALHPLADHLLGRAPTIDGSDIKELEEVLEEERRRDEGALRAQPEEVVMLETAEEASALVEILDEIPEIKPDKKRARKEERRLRKEKEREKRKRESVPETSEMPILKNKKAKKDQQS